MMEVSIPSIRRFSHLSSFGTVITGIDFESAPKDQFRRKRDDILREHKRDTMQMQTIKTKNIMVSIFYDMNGGISPSLEEQWCYQILLHAVKVAFEVKYLSVLKPEEKTKSSAAVSLLQALDIPLTEF
jgi:hypothetical protein